MREPRMSHCHGLVVIREPIYLLSKASRKEIATVDRCSLVTCQKPVSDVKGDLKGIEWSLMLRYHPQPPYNFIKTENGLVPETAPRDAWKQPAQTVMQHGYDRATEDHDPREND